MIGRTSAPAPQPGSIQDRHAARCDKQLGLPTAAVGCDMQLGLPQSWFAELAWQQARTHRAVLQLALQGHKGQRDSLSIHAPADVALHSLPTRIWHLQHRQRCAPLKSQSCAELEGVGAPDIPVQRYWCAPSAEPQSTAFSLCQSRRRTERVLCQPRLCPPAPACRAEAKLPNTTHSIRKQQPGLTGGCVRYGCAMCTRRRGNAFPVPGLLASVEGPLPWYTGKG